MHCFWKRSRTAEVVAALEALKVEFPKSRRYISDMVLYAEIGRDRKRLTMEYVEDARRLCEEFAAWG